MTERYAHAGDSPTNRKQLRHIIGIERWAARRLSVALGQPAVSDEYDGYQPDAAASWADLQADFSATRAESVRLAEQLVAQGRGGEKVRHNQFGPLSVGAWVYYMRTHAARESLAIR